MFLKKIYVKLVPRCYREAFYEKRSFSQTKKKIIATNYIYAGLQKETKDRKINLVFIVYMPETWDTLRPIYEAAKKNNRFNCYLIAQPDMENLNNNKAYNYLSKLYPDTIEAYKNNTWVELETLKPDYVFYNRPYNYQYYSNYKSDYVKKLAKICLVEYGYLLSFSHIFYICTQPEFITNVAYFFCSSKSLANKMISRFSVQNYKYPQFPYTGYHSFNIDEIPSAKKNDRQTILWTPRWTIENVDKYNSPSHFLTYIDDFLKYAEDHRDMDYIIRPHPLMFSNFIKNKVMTEEDITALYEKCNKLNIVIDTEESFLPSIYKADIIITDDTSLITNYLFNGKAVIYCDKSKYFMKETKEMHSSFYHSLSWKSIEKNIDLIRYHNDPLREKRNRIAEAVFSKNGTNSCEQILSTIYDDFIADE